MKLDNFYMKTLKDGYCEITFNKPLTEKQDIYDIKLLLEFFGRKKYKKNTIIKFKRNPVEIYKITTKKKTWALFMEYIGLYGRDWYSRIRDKNISVEEGLLILEYLAKGYVEIEGKP